MDKKRNRNESSNVRRAITGITGSILTTLMITALFAGMISKELIGEEKIDYCAAAVLLASIIAGGTISISKYENRIRSVLCMGGAYFAILAILTGIFFHAEYQRIGVTIVIVLIGCILTAMLSKKGSKNQKIRKSKIKRC